MEEHTGATIGKRPDGELKLLLVPFALRGGDLWEPVLRTRAWENGVYLAACNKVGQEGEWIFGGQSLIVDPRGTTLAEGGTEEETLFATIRRENVLEARRMRPTWRDRRPEIYTPICAFEEDVRGLV